MSISQNFLLAKKMSKLGCAISVGLLLSLNLSACFDDKTKQQDIHSLDKNSTATQHQNNDNHQDNSTKTTLSNNGRCHNELIFKQYQQHNPNIKTQVLGCGEIIKVLKDDNNGTRHQKFLVKIDNYPQITVLIAHNIDLAGRINNIQAHTPIRFYGEYIYNDKGGVVHWTHKDPAARHQNGWLEYRGQQYW